MPDLYAIFLLGTVLTLCTWMSFDNKWWIAKLFRTSFYFCLIGYVVLVLTSGFGFKFFGLTLFRDLIFICSTSAIFFLLRRNNFLSYFFLVALYASSPQIYQFLAGSEQQDRHQNISTDWELLVEMAPGHQIDEVSEIIEHYDLKAERAFQPIQNEITDLDDYFAVDIPAKNDGKLIKIMSSLLKHPVVEWVEVNEILSLDDPSIKEINQRKIIDIPFVNDPFVGNQWAFDPMNMNSYYKYIRDLELRPVKKAKLFILDTGVEGNHEDLRAYYKSYSARDDKDEAGHGTHCAGIAAGVTNNGKGVASLVPNNSFVELSSIKVLSGLGFGSQKEVINGMIKAIDAGADVISLSLGGRSSTTKEKAYNEVTAYAKRNNTIVIVAAGNSSADASKYSPANSKDVITVSATDQDQNLAYFSNTVEHVKYGIAAPGKDIYSTYINNKYKELSGTSMATPLVAGLVSMMRSINPQLDIDQVHRILDQTGVSTQSSVKSGKMVQPYDAIRKVVEESLN